RAAGGPGKLRAVATAVERALTVQEGGGGALLPAGDLGLGVPEHAPAREGEPAAAAGGMPGGTSLAEWERQMIVEALTRAKGNKSRAARLIGLTRSQLYTRMKRFGLE